MVLILLLDVKNLIKYKKNEYNNNTNNDEINSSNKNSTINKDIISRSPSQISKEIVLILEDSMEFFY